MPKRIYQLAKLSVVFEKKNAEMVFGIFENMFEIQIEKKNIEYCFSSIISVVNRWFSIIPKYNLEEQLDNPFLRTQKPTQIRQLLITLVLHYKLRNQILSSQTSNF